MAAKIPNGTVISIASVIAAGLAVTVATNASAAVLTVTNTYAVGDLVEYVSGWSLATNRIYRVSVASGTSITLEGLDTTSTTLYPIGNGVGTVRKVTTWTPILQVINSTVNGGDLQYVNFQYLENKFEQSLPTITSAASLELTLADDITLPGYIAVKAAAATGALTPVRAVLPNGELLLYDTVVGLNQNPTLGQNEVMSVKATFALQSIVNRY
jgi:hypothetical protein